MRIVQLSDTHLFEGAGFTTTNLERVIDFINSTLRPDLVIHTGDIVGLDPDHAGDRGAAAAILDGINAPLLAVPGNHDVGDPGELPWMDRGVTSARVAEHCRVFGEVPFLETVGSFGLVGLNSQVMGSGLPEEDAQWEWLERASAKTRAHSLLVFLHRPLWNPSSNPEEHDTGVPDAARERLLASAKSKGIRGVGSGHLHRYRRYKRPEMLEVWGPGTSFIGHRAEHPHQFAQCGIVEWRLDDDSISTFFRAPADLDEREFLDVPEIVNRLDGLKRDARLRESHPVADFSFIASER